VLSAAVRARPQLKPYSMTQSITTTRAYANGMTSMETIQHLSARDSELRMRDEREVAAAPQVKLLLDSGVSRATASGHDGYAIIFVFDPVEHTSLNWSTDPRMAKEARLIHSTQRAVAPRAVQTEAKQGDGLIAEERMEKLGTRNIQGVIADGTRWTTRYPAGSFGLSQEFMVVREEWFSQQYAISVESTTDDPRTGKVVTTLVSFSDAEPDPALFKLPAEYTLIGDAKVEEVAEKQ